MPPSNSHTLTLELTSGFLFFAILYSILWLYIFILHIRRTDYQSSDRIIWTITLLIPVVGLVLYWGMSGEPLEQEKKKKNKKISDGEAEARLKKKLNAMDEHPQNNAENHSK